MVCIMSLEIKCQYQSSGDKFEPSQTHHQAISNFLLVPEKEPWKPTWISTVCDRQGEICLTA